MPSRADIDLTSAEGFHEGATTGPLLASRGAGRHRLLDAIGYEERIKMPPDGRLSPEELETLRTWVAAGAPYPSSPDAVADASEAEDREASGYTDEHRAHWAFQPVRDREPPAIDDPWIRTPVDRFVLAKLREKGLEPAPPANEAALLRRVTYGLTGLPPTEAEVRSFLADDSPGAFEAVVERLLASPRYGERWARNWLDVARYADSTGNDEDHRYPYAWRYRDYVIESFNEDLPYDRFVQEQLAGDLLPSPDGDVPNRRGIVATGFLALGPKALAQQDKTRMLYDVYDEQLDVVSKGFLGLTVSCARCHDHKFDPIPTRDYYSMVGIFARTRSFADSTTHVAKLLYRPLVPEDTYERYRLHENRVAHQKASIEQAVDGAVAERNRQLVPRIDAYLLAARRVYEGGEDARAVARDAELDHDLLSAWVDYLTPRDIRRPHLAEWHDAAPEGPAAGGARLPRPGPGASGRLQRSPRGALGSHPRDAAGDGRASSAAPGGARGNGPLLLRRALPRRTDR